MVNRYLIAFILTLFSFSVVAIPKIKTEFTRSAEGFLRIKVENETTRSLACYVAIDGRKVKFHLPSRAHSKWYQATSKRYTTKSFSVWCDYIEFHPQYKRYGA